jgi:hypothetical protein
MELQWNHNSDNEAAIDTTQKLSERCCLFRVTRACFLLDRGLREEVNLGWK